MLSAYYPLPFLFSYFTALRIITFILCMSHRKCLSWKCSVMNHCRKKFFFSHIRQNKSDTVFFFSKAFYHILSVNIINLSTILCKITIKKSLKASYGQF